MWEGKWAGPFWFRKHIIAQVGYKTGYIFIFSFKISKIFLVKTNKVISLSEIIAILVRFIGLKCVFLPGPEGGPLYSLCRRPYACSPRSLASWESLSFLKYFSTSFTMLSGSSRFTGKTAALAKRSMKKMANSAL